MSLLSAYRQAGRRVLAGHGRRRVAVAALAVVVLFFGCGRVPPEAAWEPNAQDTAQIDTVIQQNKAFFKVGLGELADMYIDSTLPGTTFTILRSEVRGNPFKPRFRADGYKLELNGDFAYSFAATLDTAGNDTTCTVTIVETMPAARNAMVLHAFKMADSLRESLFFPSPGETLRLPLYDTVLTPSDTFIRKQASAVSSDGCVLRKIAGRWELWKVAGGSRFYAPSFDDAPYFFDVVLGGGGRTDTILFRPDTFHYGIQRLYDLNDTLIGSGVRTYAKTDTLRLARLRTNIGTDGAIYMYLDGRRYEPESDSNNVIPLESVSSGLHRLYIEQVPAAVLWEVQGKYTATVWGIPVRIKE